MLSLATLILASTTVAAYHRDMAAGHFIARAQMAANGLTVLLGAMVTSGAVVAFAKSNWWVAPGPATYRGQQFVNAPALAFILGMLVYLIVYPPTPWVFYTMAALSLAFGVMLLMPVGSNDAVAVVALLNGCAGLAACTSGFAQGNGIVVMAGALITASGFTLSIVSRPHRADRNSRQSPDSGPPEDART